MKDIRRQLLIKAVMRRLGLKYVDCAKFTNKDLSEMLTKQTQGYY